MMMMMLERRPTGCSSLQRTRRLDDGEQDTARSKNARDSSGLTRQLRELTYCKPPGRYSHQSKARPCSADG